MHPAMLTLMGVSVSNAALMLLAGSFAVQIIRHWDSSSGSERQLILERRTYLIATLVSYALTAEILSLLLFIYTAEQLSDQFVGAMCATGVLNVNAFGFPALLLKIAIFFLGAAWLLLNRVDNRGYDYPLVRIKYRLLLAIIPVAWAESIVQLLYFLGLKPDIITSCCGTLFSADAEGIAAELAGFKPLPTLVLFYALAIAILVSGWRFLRKRRGGILLASVSLLGFGIGIVAIISFLSLYVYESPHHHCPFCLLKAGYDYVGYWLYIPLFTATACGLGVGVIMPFARLTSLREVIHVEAQRFTILTLAGFSLFYLAASYLLWRSSLLLIP
jgi:hypothetical protein